MELDELKKRLQLETRKLFRANIIQSLRLLQIKPITKNAVDTVACGIVLAKYDFHITCLTVSWLLDITQGSALSRLHNLGDKKVFTLIRGLKGRIKFRWFLSEEFKKHYGLEI